MSTAPALRVTGLTVGYGDVVALSDLVADASTNHDDHVTEEQP